MSINEKGFIMVLSMIVLMALTVMGVGGLMIAGFQHDISGRMRCRVNSLHCAEIGKQMTLSRFNPNINTQAFPFPTVLNTASPGLCEVILMGHLPNQASPTGMEPVSIGSKAITCTNNVGCGDEPGGDVSDYRTTIVGQAVNCEPVEVEMVIRGSLGF